MFQWNIFKGEEMGFDVCKYYGLVYIFSMADCHGRLHFQHGTPHTYIYLLGLARLLFKYICNCLE